MGLLQGVSMKERLQEKEHTARLISSTTFRSLVHPQANARRYKRSDATPASGSAHLDGHLELLVFPLQLLRF